MRGSSMNPPLSIPPKRYTLLAFFLLTFAISWAFWVPAALHSRGFISFPVPSTFPLAAFGPTLAALIFTAIFNRWGGLRVLLGRLFIWRVGVLWYVFALLYPAAVSLATTALYVLFGGEAPDFSNPPILRGYPLPPEVLEISPLVLLPFFFLTQLLISSPMGEEIGWRGYALPRLQTTRSALWVSVILGMLWQLWHVPKMVAEGMTLSEAFSLWGLLGAVAVTILFTWMFNNTRGSLLLVLLFHTSFNVTGAFLSGVDAPLLTLVPTWLIVGIVIAVAGPRYLSRKLPAQKNGTDQPAIP
jgi:uncharacterized protein